MNNNLIIGVLVAIIVIGGGIWLVSSGPVGLTTTGVPTTQTTATNTNVQTPPAGQAAAAPLATTGTLIVASNSTAVLTGKVLPNGAQTSYWYEYGKTAALGTRTVTQAIGSGNTYINAPAFISGLSADTSYSFRLVAQNVSGITNGEMLSFTTNTNPPVTGNAPTIRTDAATGVARTSATLNGHVNPNNSETSYWFEYGDSSNLGNTTSFQTAGSANASESESLSVSGLAPAAKYYFRMNAQNQFGTSNGSILEFTTSGQAASQAPSANTIAATNITTSSATLNGSVNPNGDSTSYWFEYGTSQSLSSILGSTIHAVVAGSGTSPVNVSTVLPGLAANTSYSYRLVTMNTNGTVRGDIVTFRTRR